MIYLFGEDQIIEELKKFTIIRYHFAASDFEKVNNLNQLFNYSLSKFDILIIGDEINTFSGYYLITGIKTKDKVKCYLFRNKRLKKIFTNDNNKKVFHGTGCALSTSIACNLINGEQTVKSILKSLLYISKCIKKSNLKGKKSAW